MNVILNVSANGEHNNIYLTYNFSQVKDKIMVVLYDAENKHWEKIFLDYRYGFLEKNILRQYMNAESFNRFSKISNTLFNYGIQVNKNIKMNNLKLLDDHALLLIGACN